MTDLKITADQWREIDEKLAEFMELHRTIPVYHSSLDLMENIAEKIARDDCSIDSLYLRWVDTCCKLVGASKPFGRRDIGLILLRASAQVRAYAAFLAIGGKLDE